MSATLSTFGSLPVIAAVGAALGGLYLGRMLSGRMPRREPASANNASELVEARAEIERLRHELAQLANSQAGHQELARRLEQSLRHVDLPMVLLDGAQKVVWASASAMRRTRGVAGKPEGALQDRLGLSLENDLEVPWARSLATSMQAVARRARLRSGETMDVWCYPSLNQDGCAEAVLVVLREAGSTGGGGNGSASGVVAMPEPAPSSAAPLVAPACRGPRELRADEAVVRALLVEDNPVNQAVALGILRKLGLEVEVAFDGRQALDVLSRHRFHLVFMDCQMPNMDGYEATRQIRLPSSAVLEHDLPIIAVTANALKGDREKCLDAGMDDYLPKPVTREAFEKAIARWIRGWSPNPISNFPVPSDEPESNLPPVLPSREVFDRAGLLRRLLGQEELIGTLLDMFYQDTPVQMNELGNALERADYAEAMKVAHGLKGTLANLEARTASQAAAVLEHRCKAGDGVGAQEALEELRLEIARATEAMRRA